MGGSEDLCQNLSVKLVIAAATEYNHNRKDYDPGAVVVKDVAKTVVIHYVILQSRFEP